MGVCLAGRLSKQSCLEVASIGVGPEGGSDLWTSTLTTTTTTKMVAQKRTAFL